MASPNSSGDSPHGAGEWVLKPSPFSIVSLPLLSIAPPFPPISFAVSLFSYSPHHHHHNYYYYHQTYATTTTTRLSSSSPPSSFLPDHSLLENG